MDGDNSRKRRNILQRSKMLLSSKLLSKRKNIIENTIKIEEENSKMFNFSI